MAARAVLEVKIPAGGRSGVCARSHKSCDLAFLSMLPSTSRISRVMPFLGRHGGHAHGVGHVRPSCKAMLPFDGAILVLFNPDVRQITRNLMSPVRVSLAAGVHTESDHGRTSFRGRHCRCARKRPGTVGEFKSAEFCVTHMPSLKAKKLGKLT
jgi:hypothetical protein